MSFRTHAGAPQRVGKFAVLGAIALGAIIGGVAVEYWLVTRGIGATAQPRGRAAISPPTSRI